MKTMNTIVLATVLTFFGAGSALAQEASIQIIHNSPDPAAATVDIYVNGGSEPAVPDLAFRAATGLIALPADTDLVVGIAAGNSSGPGDILATWTFNLPAGSKTVVMANGLLGDDFDLFTFGLETMAPAGEVAVAAFHGAQNAPAVDVGAAGVGTLIPNLEYQTFQGYLNVPAADYVLTVAPVGGQVIAGFDAPLSGLGGNAIVVFASGFLGMEPTFGLYAALNDGTVVPLSPNGSVATEPSTLDGMKALYR